MEEATKQADGDKDKLKTLQEGIRMHKYIGETARSLYERSVEHMTDYQNLSIKSHMLKQSALFL